MVDDHLDDFRGIRPFWVFAGAVVIVVGVGWAAIIQEAGPLFLSLAGLAWVFMATVGAKLRGDHP